METFRWLVSAVEQNNTMHNAQWSDWDSANHIQEVYGELDDIYKSVFETFLDMLVRDDGKNLNTYLETYDCITYGQPFSR